jgi:hypothetical protein
VARSRDTQGIFLLASESRLVLGSVQWVTITFLGDKSRQEREADRPSPSSAEVKNE